MPRRRGLRLGCLGRGSDVASGHNTFEISGIGAGTGACIGDTTGISLALGDSAVATFGAGYC